MGIDGEAAPPSTDAGNVHPLERVCSEDGRLRVSWNSGSVVAVGEIDMSNAALFRSALQGAADGRRVSVDLRAVTYLDSAAVEILYNYSTPRLQLLVAPGSAVAKIMRICGLARVADVADSFPSTGEEA